MLPAAGRAARHAPVRVGDTGRPWFSGRGGVHFWPRVGRRDPLEESCGRSGLRPGTETGGTSAEARVKGALGPR